MSASTKSLQDLAAKKTIEALLKSDTCTTDFLALDDHQKGLIFTSLIKQYKTLQDDSARLEALEGRTPWLDWALYARGHDRIPRAHGEFDGDDADDDADDDDDDHEHANTDADRDEDAAHVGDLITFEEDLARSAAKHAHWRETNPHGIKKILREKWTYATSSQHELYERSFNVFRNPHFSVMSLLIHGATAAGKMEMCNEQDQMGGGGGEDAKCKFQWNEHHYLWDKISSQLLYYRVTSMFGMPPAVEGDGYKVAWWAELAYKGDQAGRGATTARTPVEDSAPEASEVEVLAILQIGDWKGSPSASCRARDQKSLDAALELLNFLTQVEMPHTYVSHFSFIEAVHLESA
jgi:hypothetical protein